MKLERKYTREEKKELVAACLEREGSINSWCKKNKLPSSTFHGWLKKYGISNESSDFIELIPAEKIARKKFETAPSAHTYSSVILIEYNGFKINLDSNVDSIFLRNVLKAVVESNV